MKVVAEREECTTLGTRKLRQYDLESRTMGRTASWLAKLPSGQTTRLKLAAPTRAANATIATASLRTIAREDVQQQTRLLADAFSTVHPPLFILLRRATISYLPSPLSCVPSNLLSTKRLWVQHTRQRTGCERLSDQSERGEAVITTHSRPQCRAFYPFQLASVEGPLPARSIRDRVHEVRRTT